MRNKLLIILLIIVLLVVYYLFGMDYMKQRKEHEALTSQITDVALALKQIPELPQDLEHDLERGLEQQLAAAKARLVTEQSAFPSKINSTEVINSILELGDDCEVKAIPLVTQPWSIENVGEHDYYVFRLNVAIEGSFSQLVNFISELENGKFKTLVVENLSVTRAAEQPEGETIPEGTVFVTASLDLAIYSQSLTSD